MDTRMQGDVLKTRGAEGHHSVEQHVPGTTYADTGFVNPCPDLTADEYEALKAKIERQGFLPAFPVVRSAGPARLGDIVDGFHRTKICGELGIEPVIVDLPFDTEEQFLIEQIDANLNRRQLSKYDRVTLVRTRDGLQEKEDARSRRLANLRQGDEIPDPESFPGREPQGDTRDKLGQQAGMSGRTYEKFVYVQDHGDDFLNEELKTDRRGADWAYKAAKEWREAETETGQKWATYLDYRAHITALEEAERAQVQAEEEIEDIWFNNPETKAATTASERDRAVGDLIRSAEELDKLVRQHGITDQDVAEFNRRSHTFTGTARRLADWFDLTAGTLELTRSAR